MSDAPVIEVDQLTRVYPGRVAVDRLTFSVGRGEIVGFLGPNGAGKSTTMRMLAGYLPPTSGAVRIAGLDPDGQPDQVRRKVGYMPENNPLHLDMRVVDYLCFRGRIKGLGWRASPAQAEAVIRRCGLGEVRTRVIGQLSKGYRQRVGIADAILHDPELILLDEPTIGLDPHQIRAVRDLIRQLGQKHTVLISTHILSEVEMMCSRVLNPPEGAAHRVGHARGTGADAGLVGNGDCRNRGDVRSHRGTVRRKPGGQKYPRGAYGRRLLPAHTGARGGRGPAVRRV